MTAWRMLRSLPLSLWARFPLPRRRRVHPEAVEQGASSVPQDVFRETNDALGAPAREEVRERLRKRGGDLWIHVLKSSRDSLAFADQRRRRRRK